MEVAPSFRLDYVYLNHTKKPFDDWRIRLAVNYATNDELLMKAICFDCGSIPDSFMPKVNYWSDKVEPIAYDLEKATALVKEAGYDGTPVQLMVDTGNAASRQTATILQSSWTKIGLAVEIVAFDGGTAFGMTLSGDYQSYVSYFTSDINDSDDSDELATLQADGTGSTKAFYSNYNNPEVTSLLAEARAEPDTTKRAALYEQNQGIDCGDGYSVPLNFLPYVNGDSNDLKNWSTITVG